jgi:hypothetical protein
MSKEIDEIGLPAFSLPLDYAPDASFPNALMIDDADSFA